MWVELSLEVGGRVGKRKRKGRPERPPVDDTLSGQRKSGVLYTRISSDTEDGRRGRR